MLALTQVVQTFPSAQLPGAAGGPPVEVTLVAQLGIGAGDRIHADASARQRAHEHYVDALDEPSARLGGMHLAQNDPTSLYTFAVGSNGHPFHRHAGHRIFTAISGSGGAQLRFCSASDEQIQADPHSFLRQLRFVDIPPDCLFTVRFGGNTWHQFVPAGADAAHPALFALSCHSNELGGTLSAALRTRIEAGDASIPALTELLPDRVSALLRSDAFDPRRVSTVALALNATATSPRGSFCAGLRSRMGRMRTLLPRWGHTGGFLSANGSGHAIAYEPQLPPRSLLQRELGDDVDHQDRFVLTTGPSELRADSASAWLSALLQGFLDNAPVGVARLMALRNALVRPLGLRTSPLGCPVSSLLSAQREQLFAGRFPVLAQRSDGRSAEVVLGADDRHLRFRSSVSVEIDGAGRIRFSLATRVQPLNLFGRFYMACIARIHRHYIAPTMLSLAAAWAIDSRGLQRDPGSEAGLVPRA
ncbi:uncharacterized protein DUF2867 [Tahibacter aquaticus]|uniref:Uncharacterized protein DUF2867 n=1 Tax=Tahibacter aquaticus TaxID=520092 RepID=A0A4R6Z4V7_9GAMM|nr:DUF2867 domain-containing protein [Tahibacter aquaticus]TDR46691.1 uncharacterized protein DUF2867 [Tahibacter aquaticus]